MAPPDTSAKDSVATRSETKKDSEKASVKALFLRVKGPKEAADALVDDQGIDDLDTL